MQSLTLPQPHHATPHDHRHITDIKQGAMSAEAELAGALDENGGGEGEEEYYEEEEEAGMEGTEGVEEGGEGQEGAVAAAHDDPDFAAELQRQQEKIRQEEEKLKEMMKDVAGAAGAGAGAGAGGEGEEGANGEAAAAAQAAIDENSM